MASSGSTEGWKLEDFVAAAVMILLFFLNKFIWLYTTLKIRDYVLRKMKRMGIERQVGFKFS